MRNSSPLQVQKPPAAFQRSLIPPRARCASLVYCMPTEHSLLHPPLCRLDRRATLLVLPHELLFKIATHVVTTSGVFPGSTFISSKPHWGTIAGLASASRATRDVALRAWFTTLVLKGEEDWDVVAGFGDVRLFVRCVLISLGGTILTNIFVIENSMFTRAPYHLQPPPLPSLHFPLCAQPTSTHTTTSPLTPAPDTPTTPFFRKFLPD